MIIIFAGMRSIELDNPFVVGKYVSDKYFCDRETETEFLVKQIVNGRNVALISERRMGKSGLIQHTFAQKRICDSYDTFFVDIYSTGNLAEFAYLLGKAVFEKLKPQKTKWMESFFRVVASLKFGFRLDPVSGEPSLDVGVGDIKAPETTLDEIFRYLEASGKKCVVAIDEFQQIGEYREKNVEALLRTKIQQCTKTQFVFAGSKRHLMSNMFHSPAKPFYQSVITMGLEAISLEKYTSFAKGLFQEGGKDIDAGVISTVYNEFDGITWFVQMMMNELYSITDKGETCVLSYIDGAKRNIIQVQDYSYCEILSSLSFRQKQLIQVFAKEGLTGNVTSTEFISKHRLGSASSVQSALAALVEKDLVTKRGEGYSVYDYFFSEWIRMNY